MRRLIVVSTILSVCVAVSSLAGCGLIPKPDNTAVNQYDITPKVAARNTTTVTCAKVLEVRGVSASAPWMGTDMLYTQNKHEIKSYAYNQWAATPATMLGHALVSALKDSDLYRGVLGPSTPGSADLILAVTLNRGPLQVFPPQSGENGNTADSSREALSLSATLASMTTGQLIASKTFSDSQAANADPYGGVVAANALAGRLFGEMLDWLGKSNSGIKACSAH
jgi:ABC-type uncharacterized transport system auxiliary subunit